MQLCFACLHPFPDENFSDGHLPFSDVIRGRFESLRRIANKLQSGPSQPLAQQYGNEIEEEVIGLARAMKQVIDEMNSNIQQLTSQLWFLSEREETARREQKGLTLQYEPHTKKKPSKSFLPSAPSIGALDRFISSSKNSLVGKRGLISCDYKEQNKFGEVTGGPKATDFLKTDSRLFKNIRSDRKRPCPPKPQYTSKMFANSSLYGILESVAVKTRADLAVLWIRMKDADELVSPFVSGRNGGKQPSAPHTIGLTSIPGSVALSGVALSMTAENIYSPRDFKPASIHELLSMNCTKHSSLTLPIYTRYGDTSRKTIGVLQLFGASKVGAPFTIDDERLASTASQFFSHLISTYYDSMISEWCTSTFDPTPLAANATYFPEIDQDPSNKGVDDFSTTPTLVYRGKFVQCSEDTPLNIRNLRRDMAEFSSPIEVCDGLRDITRYITGLEDFWRKSALQGHISGVSTDINTTPPTRQESTKTSATAIRIESGKPRIINTVAIETLQNETLERIQAMVNSKKKTVL